MESEEDEKEDEKPHHLVHPRPLFGGPTGHPHSPFLAAGLAAMAAAAAASAKGPLPSQSGLFPGFNGLIPTSSGPSVANFPPLGFPGFQHPLFKPGMFLKRHPTAIVVTKHVSELFAVNKTEVLTNVSHLFVTFALDAN